MTKNEQKRPKMTKNEQKRPKMTKIIKKMTILENYDVFDPMNFSSKNAIFILIITHVIFQKFKILFFDTNKNENE